MKTSVAIGGLTLTGVAVLVGQMSATAVPGVRGGGVAGAIGQDVIVGALPNVQKFGTVGGITAYSIGTTSCNIGDAILTWQQSTNQHPVISQNMYRYHEGRFEMIGMSWLKHGFCALQQTLCGPCIPAGAGCPSALGIGCSDPYSSELNGQQSNLGPRSQVNASTGFFPYPFTAPAAPATIGRRLQIANVDLDPSLNPGAKYFAEGMYVHPEDAVNGNAMNNASYREGLIGTFTSGGYNINLTGPTVQQVPAVHAWKALDPAVEIKNVDVISDGRFIVAYRVYDNGDGTWDYEFAVKNFNSHKSARAFSVPVPDGVNITNIDAHIINHHSGEPYSTAPWDSEVSGGAITWSTETFAANQNANALRWNTMFNFRSTADTAPQDATATIVIFRPNGPASASVVAVGPSEPAPSCASDLNGDGSVDGADLGVLLLNWGTDGTGDLNGDGVVDGADLGILLLNWGDC